jgi:hypothetical protein
VHKKGNAQEKKKLQAKEVCKERYAQEMKCRKHRSRRAKTQAKQKSTSHRQRLQTTKEKKRTQRNPSSHCPFCPFVVGTNKLNPFRRRNRTKEKENEPRKTIGPMKCKPKAEKQRPQTENL